jgi:hypothetical protein
MAEFAVNRRISRALSLGFAMFVFTAPAPAADQPQLPRPPCATEPVPDYPPVGVVPAVKLWTGSDLGPGWTPPACTLWPNGAASVVVGLAGHFDAAGGADALLARIGAISSLIDVRYWSVTDKRWDNLFTRAVALYGPDPKKTRRDFSAAELSAGGSFYFVTTGKRSGKDIVVRLQVIAIDSARLVLETENVTPLRSGFFTFAAPGNLQSWYFLDRDIGSAWRFYGLTRVLYASSFLGIVIPKNSYINRAVAMYRHFLELPTDRDPPAAP